MEDQLLLNDHILTCAHKAIGYYKQRSQILKGPSGALHTRTVHMINYHISELVSDSSFINSTERQKYRKQISESLIKEEWVPEAMHLVEKAKTDSSSTEEWF